MTDELTGDPPAVETPRGQRRTLGALTVSVQELNKNVVELRQLVQEDYPTRREVDRKRKYAIIFSILFVLGVIVIASLSTLATVSYCFLQPSGPHKFCSAIPGYSYSIEARDAYLQSQADLQQLIIDNRATLIEMQKEIDDLQANQNPGG